MTDLSTRDALCLNQTRNSAVSSCFVWMNSSLSVVQLITLFPSKQTLGSDLRISQHSLWFKVSLIDLKANCKSRKKGVDLSGLKPSGASAFNVEAGENIQIQVEAGFTAQFHPDRHDVVFMVKV